MYSIQPLRRFRTLQTILIIFLFTAPFVHAETSKTKLKGLLVTGGCCHDYPRQIKIITEGISQRVSISWEVAHGDRERNKKVPFYEKENWIEGFDIVVHNECYGGVEDVEFVERIAKAHEKSGVAAVAIHCSMHSYRHAKTDEWRKLLGVTSRQHERGGRKLDVTNIAKDHPIMQGFPDRWQTPNGELYKIENIWGNCTPLATAYGVDTKKDHVCIWTNRFGKAKIFGTTLGHHNETMLADEWLDVVARGVLWTVGKLKEDGTAVAGYQGTGIAPFSFQKKIDPTKQPTPAD